MIYGFTGHKQSGKNTCANIWSLLDSFHSEKVQKIRVILRCAKDTSRLGQSITYGLSLSDTIELYNNETTFVKFFLKESFPKISSWQHKQFGHKIKEIVCLITGCTLDELEDGDFKNSVSPYNGLTYRELCSFVGTDLFRNLLDVNIWNSILLKEYDKDLTNTWLITDVRRLSEDKNIHDRGGKIIRVIQTIGEYEVINSHSLLSSENEIVSINADYTIHSDRGDIDNLIKQVKNIMINENVLNLN